MLTFCLDTTPKYQKSNMELTGYAPMETRKLGSLFCLDTPSGLPTLGPTLVNNAVTRSVNREVLPVHSKHSVKWLQQKHSDILLIRFWHVMLGFAHCRVTSSLLRRSIVLTRFTHRSINLFSVTFSTRWHIQNQLNKKR